MVPTRIHIDRFEVLVYLLHKVLEDRRRSLVEKII